MNALTRSAAGLLNARRVRHYPIICLIMIYALYAVSLAVGDFPFDWFGSPIAVDFTAKVTAGRMALAGELDRVYEADRQWAVQQELLDHHDPTFLNIFIAPAVGAYPYAPFAAMPYVPAAALWTLASLCFFAGALRILWPLLPRLHQIGLGQVALLAFSAPPVIECIQTGQDSLVSLLLLSIVIRSLATRNELGAGVALGLGMFKPQLFILFPVLLLAQRRWRALCAYAAVSTVMVTISVASVGFDGVRAHLDLLRSDLYMVGLAESGGWNMQSLPAMLNEFIPIEFRRVVQALILAAGVVGIWLLGRRYGPVRAEGGERELRLYASVVLMTAIVNPHMFLYDYSVTLIPILILLASAKVSDGLRVAVAALYILLLFAPVIHVLTSRLPAAVQVLDSQWSLAATVALLVIAWRGLRGRESGNELVPRSRSRVSLA